MRIHFASRAPHRPMLWKPSRWIGQGRAVEIAKAPKQAVRSQARGAADVVVDIG
jgi:hypothetical protein